MQPLCLFGHCRLAIVLPTAKLHHRRTVTMNIICASDVLLRRNMLLSFCICSAVGLRALSTHEIYAVVLILMRVRHFPSHWPVGCCTLHFSVEIVNERNLFSIISEFRQCYYYRKIIQGQSLPKKHTRRNCTIVQTAVSKLPYVIFTICCLSLVVAFNKADE